MRMKFIQAELDIAAEYSSAETNNKNKNLLT